MFLTLHDDIISVYISVSVYQQMSLTLHDDKISVYIYIYTTSEKPVNDQSYGVLDRYGITILYK